jgi:hypothetical protein
MRKTQKHARVAERVEERPRRQGAPLRCAVPDCPVGTVGDECLCRGHWDALPWSLRNDAGTGWRAPSEPSPGWLRDVLALLGAPVPSVHAGAALSPEERRFRPEALAILATYEYQRPDYRSCTGGQHPCPWVSCPSHLKLTLTEGGTLQDNHPGVDVDEMEETCAEDVARKGGASATRVGQLLGIKRGRVGQIERKFKARLRPLLD